MLMKFSKLSDTQASSTVRFKGATESSTSSYQERVAFNQETRKGLTW